MVALPCGIFEGGSDVTILQQRIIGEDLGAIGVGGKQVEHVTDADAQSAQAPGRP